LAERRNSGHLHLEAIERAVRSALPHAGAAALGQLRPFPSPTAQPRNHPWRLRPSGSVPRMALPAGPHGGGRHPNIASLLPRSTLP
jgi:hypothetical protein